MKVNRLETHDRLKHLVKDQSLNISQGATDCLRSNSLSLAMQDRSPYIYIFAHPRTADDGVTKRMLWQPRLTKPKAQTNSYLFRAKSHSDVLEVCWLLPPKEMWDQYKKKNVTESEWVLYSIDQYVNNRQKLEEKHPEDLEDKVIQHIYQEIKRTKSTQTLMDKLHGTK
jgi:hypothetical protein